MVADNLTDWLRYLERLHPTPMELGLERVRAVAEAMQLCEMGCPVITVGGTNGKGSTVSYLDAIYRAAGYRTALQVSPHLVRFNERVLLNGVQASDADLLRALAAVETGRGDISLTYFEYTVLAAVWLFRSIDPDLVILEVGLGGRLDVTNIWDADAVVVTNVALDHQRWLGDDRESIGFEKAHTARTDRLAVCCDPSPPQRLRDHWRQVGAAAQYVGEDFYVETTEQGWRWRDGTTELDLPLPGMAGGFQLANASGAVTVVQGLQTTLPVDQAAIASGIQSASINGRLQHFRIGDVEVVLDVAHNGAAAQALADSLAGWPGRLFAVSAVMADKDLDGILAHLSTVFDRWYLGDLEIERALSADAYAQRLAAHGVGDVQCRPRLLDALNAALEDAESAVKVVVFGSLYTVADVIEIVVARAD
ncbi:MAG: bifunctional tetrahydrofolate synthase/dihydrofolate synthase [Pseudomonadota bacterium]